MPLLIPGLKVLIEDKSIDAASATAFKGTPPGIVSFTNSKGRTSSIAPNPYLSGSFAITAAAMKLRDIFLGFAGERVIGARSSQKSLVSYPSDESFYSVFTSVITHSRKVPTPELIEQLLKVPCCRYCRFTYVASLIYPVVDHKTIFPARLRNEFAGAYRLHG